MSLSRPTLAVGAALAALLLLLLVPAAWLVANRPPKSAAEQLARARAARDAAATRVAELTATGDPADATRAGRERGRVLLQFARVETLFPGAPEIEPADLDAMRLRDETSTDPATRLALRRAFAERHSTGTLAADPRWEAARILRDDLRKPLEAIKAYDEFARMHPKDPRAAEALFRSAQILEEIREFAKAMKAYRRVTKEYPESPFAKKAQFQIGTLLAERLEKKEEAAKEFAKVEAANPGGELAAAAGGQRRRLEGDAARGAGDTARDKYYRGVREVRPDARMLDEVDKPPMRAIRAQATDLVAANAEISLDGDSRTLTATVAMRIASRADGPGTSGTMGLQLGIDAKVATATREGRPVEFSRQGPYVFFDLGTPMIAGTTETFRLAYTLTDTGEPGMQHITSSSSFLLAENWLPCGDFGDAFTADVRVTAAAGHAVFCQGVTAGPKPAAAGKAGGGGAATWVFRDREPRYYHALASGRYVTKSVDVPATAGAARGPLRVTMATFPETTPSLAALYLKDLPGIVSFYESKLGPFPDPKLDVVQVQKFPGGLSSPGLIVIGPPGFDRDDAPAEFLAHEVAHAWFGNLLGLDLSPGSKPWLSEGVSEYWDLLYHEHRQGASAFRRLLRERAETYYRALAMTTDRPLDDARFRDPIYAPLTYSKGAFVLHGLRGVIGDEAFFRTMRDFVARHRGTVVRLSDLRAAAERAHGAPLGWYFDDWTGGVGIPRWRVASARQAPRPAGGVAGKYVTTVEIEQVGRPFRMPLDVEIRTKAGPPARRRIDLAETTATVTFETAAEPVTAALDPDYKVLKFPKSEEWEKPVTLDPPITATNTTTGTLAK